jgi:hypothetical protein
VEEDHPEPLSGHVEKQPQDAFEASEMHDGARVVWRDKVVSRLMAALLAIPGLMTIGIGVLIALANATSRKPVPAAAVPFVIAAIAGLGVSLCVLGVVFGVLRTVVTERAVHVKYGLWGPTIVVESIRSCRVVDYDWKRFGGWGIRRGPGGVWAYVPSSPGNVVEIVYLDGNAERRVLVGAANAEETVRRIERQRNVRISVRPRVAEEAAKSGARGTEVTDEELDAEAPRGITRGGD